MSQRRRKSKEFIQTIGKPKAEPEVIALGNDEACKVTVLQDSVLTYPELWLEVFIQGADFDRSLVQMFAKARCFQAKRIEEADLVVFTGGPDVDPSIYNCKDIHPKTMIDKARDDRDMETFVMAQALGIPMVGICRGSQFLHTMMGGRLYQHVEGHLGPHSMIDSNTQRLIQRISSTHHQGIIYHKDMLVLGESLHKQNKRWIDSKTEGVSSHRDIEAYFYRKNCILGFQGHPEFTSYGQYSKWCMDKIDHYIRHNPDICVSETDFGRFNRIKQDLVLNPM